jgi:hypothetical protein
VLPQIRLHDLRHTHATLALQAGVHPKVVSERLGHVTVSITLDTYSHATPAMQEEAAALSTWLPPRGRCVVCWSNKAFEQTRRSEVQDRGVGARSSTPGR